MPKNVVSDIIPPDKRTIRNIPIPEGRKVRLTRTDGISNEHRREIEEKIDADIPHPPNKPPKRLRDESFDPETASYGKKPRGSRKTLWGIAIGCLLVLAFAVSSLFESATVNVTPKEALVPVSGTFTASLNGGGKTLPFKVITVTRDDGKEVAAGAEQHVDSKATGKIIVYNNSGSAPQKLIANTRFQNTDGLIFRTPSAITIPGQTIQNGQKIPGSLEVTVVADEAGEKYNIGLSDFKIPGFKGDGKYDTVFAHSKTPMTGGFSGNKKVVAEDALSNTKDEIQTNLKDQLLKDVQAQIPLNYSYLNDGLFYSFDDLPETDSGTDSVKVNLHGILNAVIFDKNALGQLLASRFIPDFNSMPVVIDNMSDLGFKLASSTNFNPATSQSFDFTLSGSAKLIWQYDEDALRGDLAGVGKSEVNTVLEKYPSISEATVTLRPFWKTTLPKNPKDITIEKTGDSGS